MFKRESGSNVVDVSLSRVDTILGRKSKFSGELEIDGDLRLDSSFEGSIKCGGTVLIGPDAWVKAAVAAKRVVVSGRLDGGVVASETVTLQTGCRVSADVEAPSVVMQDGVFYEGRCRMGDQESDRSSERTGPRPPSHKPTNPGESGL